MKCNYCQTTHQENHGLGSFSLTDAITNPQGVIEAYKKQALYGVMIFAGILLTGNYLMLHQALNQKIKKIRK